MRDARRLSNDPSMQYSSLILNEALINIEDKYISINSKILIQLGMEAPVQEASHELDRDVLRERTYDREKLRQFVETNKQLLIPDQRRAYNTLTQCIHDNEGGLLSLDAPGGTGKTFIINK